MSRTHAELIEIIRAHGPLARSEIAQHTLLSQQSIHRLTEELVKMKLLQRHDAIIKGRGKPSPRLAIDPNGAYAAGLSIEPDAITICWVDFSGAILKVATVAATPNSPAEVLARTVEMITDGCSALKRPLADLAGFGISMQGFRTDRRDASSFTTPLQLEAWSGVDVAALFAPRLTCPVYAENDAALGAVAEQWYGAGRGLSSFVYLAINFGLGGGLVINNRVYYGAHGNAAELSDMYLKSDTPRRPALGGLLAQMRKDGLNVSSIREVIEHADPQSPSVKKWIETVSPQLNQLVRAATAIIDPEAILYGGQAPRALRRLLIAATQPRYPDRYGRAVPGPQLRLAEVEQAPSAVGAAIYAMRRTVLNRF
ncbi:ROK family transcriptional regulator [Pseudohoeflea coraliihabitans]|uniref:ROK family transcriptional regulator n=1 Tax=Pseudohoeflea coraliihabitans TaxID=2860393 RepID=A0ABS6WPP9_9HYPH|nr:ROK family transcriptional regulator [Pseudohoeflea sp. DP4N28-3]